MNLQTSYLSRLGGRDLVTKINKVLKHCMTNEVATRYSFYGKRQGKRPLNDLQLKNCVIGEYLIKLCKNLLITIKPESFRIERNVCTELH